MRVVKARTFMDRMVTEAPEGRADVCQLCFGTGLEVVPGRGARRCECARKTADDLVAAAGLPERHAHCSLQNYTPEPGNGSQLLAFGLAYRLVGRWPDVKRGLLLSGPCGVGKTHLGVAILRGLAGKGAGVLFAESGPLLKQIQATFDRQSEETERDVLAPVREAEVLLLDELGAARPTEWALGVLDQVIGERYKSRRLTLVTTNYGDEPGGGFGETLGERVGPRIRSRLREMCKTVRVEGADYRARMDEEDF